jgi:hypothetical protein
MEIDMRERAHPNRMPTIDTFPDPPVAPQIDTPVIQTQDLEHNPAPETRVSNKGIKVTPTLNEDEDRDLAKEDEEALKSVEELEKQYRGQAPS